MIAPALVHVLVQVLNQELYCLFFADRLYLIDLSLSTIKREKKVKRKSISSRREESAALA